MNAARDRAWVVHPSTVIMVLLLAGLSMLFIAIAAAYIYTRINTGVEAPFPPILFFINIPVLLFANRFLRKAKKEFSSSKNSTVLKSIILCGGITILFGILQMPFAISLIVSALIFALVVVL